ncbi:hypothetical protein LTR27_005625 [Elasticomyces elasticus]|nr:hypothetical protein LTR27_005625 [Elasticomyces elasticus]
MLTAKEDRTKALVAMETGIWSRLPPEVQNLIIERLAASAVQGREGGVMKVGRAAYIDNICDRLIPKSCTFRLNFRSLIPVMMIDAGLARDANHLKLLHVELQIASKPGGALTCRPSDLYTYIDQLKGFLEGNTPALSTLQINIDDRYVDKYALKVRKGKTVLTVDAYEKELIQLKAMLRSLTAPLVVVRFHKVEIEQKGETKSYLSARRAVFCRQEHEGIWFNRNPEVQEDKEGMK